MILSSFIPSLVFSGWAPSLGSRRVLLGFASCPAPHPESALHHQHPQSWCYIQTLLYWLPSHTSHLIFSHCWSLHSGVWQSPGLTWRHPSAWWWSAQPRLLMIDSVWDTTFWKVGHWWSDCDWMNVRLFTRKVDYLSNIFVDWNMRSDQILSTPRLDPDLEMRIPEHNSCLVTDD